jgi:hypothetical protein
LIPAIHSNSIVYRHHYLFNPLSLHTSTIQSIYISAIKRIYQMAAAGRMLSVIREELPTVVSELASTAKVSTEQVGRLGEMEVASTSTATTMNPIAVRQMASVSVKEGGKSLPPVYMSKS